MSDAQKEVLKKLRAPVEAHHISKKPVPTRQQTEDLKANRNLGIKCQVCGGWHHKNVEHLDYMGHAAVTDRLLEVDPLWDWDYIAKDQNGNPIYEQNGGLWITLTVCGVTRKGYGAAEGKKGSDAIKEIIGDAIRNGAMRFGVGLELWHKGVLHMDVPEDEEEPAKFMLSQNWHDAVEKCTSQEALQFVWETGVKEYDKLGDIELYNAFKKAVGAKKKLLSQDPEAAQ